MVAAHVFENYFIFHMLIGLGKDMTPINFEFPGSKVKVTRVVFVKVCLSVDQMVSAHYLEIYISQSFYISYADWSW